MFQIVCLVLNYFLLYFCFIRQLVGMPCIRLHGKIIIYLNVGLLVGSFDRPPKFFLPKSHRCNGGYHLRSHFGPMPTSPEKAPFDDKPNHHYYYYQKLARAETALDASQRSISHQVSHNIYSKRESSTKG